MKTTILLNNGQKIPTLGLGTWMSKPGLVGKAVEYALLQANYRHIDCAAAYENEKEIGEALTTSFKKVKRSEVFITSKLWNTNHRSQDIVKACKQTLLDLHLDYLDLYLMHWGIAFRPGKDVAPKDQNGRIILEPVSIKETWTGMEELVKQGLVKSIGVANFNTLMLVDLLTYIKIKPVMNQIELHPYNTQTELIEFCKYNAINVTAYSPLGRQGENTQGPKLFDEPLIQQLAKKYKKSLSQILLSWAISRGTIAIPKSTTLERISENGNIYDFEMNKEEVDILSSLNKNIRFVNPYQDWGIPCFS